MFFMVTNVRIQKRDDTGPDMKIVSEPEMEPAQNLIEKLSKAI